MILHRRLVEIIAITDRIIALIARLIIVTCQEVAIVMVTGVVVVVEIAQDQIMAEIITAIMVRQKVEAAPELSRENVVFADKKVIQKRIAQIIRNRHLKKNIN